MSKKRINNRGLTSFLMLFGFIIMMLTGLVLYIVPAGRIAYWVNWELTGLTKTDWGNIYIISGILFIVAGVFHIYFNWKVLIHYFKDKIMGNINLKRELLIASIISAVFILSSLYQLRPISYLLDLNEFIKNSWIAIENYEPPIGHAELLSLNTFTKKMKIDIEKVVIEFKLKGIKFDNTDVTLENISKENNISPMDLYMIIKKYAAVAKSSKINEFSPEMEVNER